MVELGGKWWGGGAKGWRHYNKDSYFVAGVARPSGNLDNDIDLLSLLLVFCRPAATLVCSEWNVCENCLCSLSPAIDPWGGLRPAAAKLQNLNIR